MLSFLVMLINLFTEFWNAEIPVINFQRILAPWSKHQLRYENNKRSLVEDIPSSAKWINLALYSSPGCTGLPSRGNSIAMDACQHLDNGGWKFVQYSLSKEGKVVKTIYSNSDCSGFGALSDTFSIGCINLSDNEYLSVTVNAIYSFPVDAVVQKYVPITSISIIFMYCFVSVCS